MALVVVTIDPGTEQAINSGDEVLVLDGVTITSSTDLYQFTGSTDNTFGNYEFILLGDAYAGRDFVNDSLDGPSANPENANVYVTIGATGSLYAGEDFVVLGATDFGIAEAALTVTNAGFVSVGETAIFAIGFDRVEFTNTGTLVQTATNADDADALFLDLGTGGASIVNHGIIQSGGNNAIIDDDISGSTVTLLNTGVMSTAGVTAFNLTGSTGVFLLDNSGEISGDIVSASTVFFTNTGTYTGFFDLTGNNNEITNSGTIIGLIGGDNTSESVTNSGEIIGDLIMDAGNDEVINSGTITGDVNLGGDNDTYIASGLGTVTGEVLGQGGNDTLTGGDLSDVLRGDGGDDVINGGAGDDILEGGSNNDTLRGGTGADDLEGTSGTNLLMGGDGNDTLNGGTGADRLIGGTGNDRIISGAGADIIRGGSGQDVFVFGSAAETGTGSTRDRILGFEDGVDIIDLTGFGPLEFSATGPVGGGTASVWFQSVSGGAQTMLRIDTDGNGVFDGQVLLVRADLALFDQDDLILA